MIIRMSSTLKPTEKPKGKQALTCAICALLAYGVLYFGSYPKASKDDVSARIVPNHVAAAQPVK